jgi:hypothetical protein
MDSKESFIERHEEMQDEVSFVVEWLLRERPRNQDVSLSIHYARAAFAELAEFRDGEYAKFKAELNESLVPKSEAVKE